MEKVQNKSNVGKRIAKIMIRVGINQKGLADYLGISQPAISLYLKGRIPPADVLLQIANLGGTTVEWLLSGETEENDSGKVNRVSENAQVYGTKLVLFDIWERLPNQIRQDVLVLLQDLVKQFEKKVT
jgi:transcriptional regulator with XRE-family HTH domain